MEAVAGCMSAGKYMQTEIVVELSVGILAEEWKYGKGFAPKKKMPYKPLKSQK